jgi:hypothetical protein
MIYVSIIRLFFKFPVYRYFPDILRLPSVTTDVRGRQGEKLMKEKKRGLVFKDSFSQPPSKSFETLHLTKWN